MEIFDLHIEIYQEVEFQNIYPRVIFHKDSGVLSIVLYNIVKKRRVGDIFTQFTVSSNN